MAAAGDLIPTPTPPWAYVLYNVPGDTPWHQRAVLGRVASSRGEIVIATPDGEVYVENVDPAGLDVRAVHWADYRRPTPVALGGQTYRFRV